ncbi:E3 ubiquitin ligase family protein [Natrinema sp. SYSU A 869]|uniref:E3 ubiquitin ligase family protein n=1 Tax=Natrinema sp. SYSU A 869 TaxID=2871694 RepID=UPI001CA3D198|nr:E3 ubiquitin ligase family protein [Natrinema sp. SYSU A 869]
MGPLAATAIGATSASAITGLDLAVLLLLLHVWGFVVGVDVYNDDAASGLDWATRRIHVGTRPYAVLMLVATVIVWLPFAVGSYPFLGNAPIGRSRGVVVPVAVGGLLVGSGFYFLGGLLTTLRSYATLRRATSTAPGAADHGLVAVSGRVVPLREPLVAPLTGRDAVWYRLTATTTSSKDAKKPGGGADDSLFRSVLTYSTDPARVIADQRTSFALEADTGRVVVDPTDAACRLERPVSKRVAADESLPEPLATRLWESADLETSDRDRRYRESVLEVGETATVLGIAESEGGGTSIVATDDSIADFVVAPGGERQVARALRETIAGCVFATVVLTGGGFALLWWLAGHGLP